MVKTQPPIINDNRFFHDYFSQEPALLLFYIDFPFFLFVAIFWGKFSFGAPIEFIIFIVILTIFFGSALFIKSKRYGQLILKIGENGFHCGYPAKGTTLIFSFFDMVKVEACTLPFLSLINSRHYPFRSFLRKNIYFLGKSLKGIKVTLLEGRTLWVSCENQSELMNILAKEIQYHSGQKLIEN